jgi:spore coat polysaccharide biosynthesis protein SpsF
MGSTRLPGKVLLPLSGKSLLVRLTERLSKAKTLDAVLVATTDRERDDAIEEECSRHGIDCFRGDEFDVLGRYAAAASISRAGIVVRVTADNPFTDPESIDRVNRVIASGEADYAIETNLPVGTTGETLTRSALTFLDEVALLPRWREHVTLYAKEHTGVFRCNFLEPPLDVRRSDLSFTVDESSDYEYVRRLSECAGASQIRLQNLIALADEMKRGARTLAVQVPALSGGLKSR